MRRSSPNRNAPAGVGVRCSRERTDVQSPNPGRRRDRLAGAVHRDDRHLDPGTGKFVTVVAARSRRVISTSIMPLLGQAGPVDPLLDAAIHFGGPNYVFVGDLHLRLTYSVTIY
jgi:hypothetical protein